MLSVKRSAGNSPGEHKSKRQRVAESAGSTGSSKAINFLSNLRRNYFWSDVSVREIEQTMPFQQEPDPPQGELPSYTLDDFATF